MGFMKLAEWIENILPTLLQHGVKRIDGTVEEGDVSAYWAGSVLRIDLKPDQAQ